MTEKPRIGNLLVTPITLKAGKREGQETKTQNAAPCFRIRPWNRELSPFKAEEKTSQACQQYEEA